MTRGSSISSFFKKLSVKGSRGKTGHTSQQKEEQVEVTGSSTDQVSVPPAPVDTAKDTHSNEAPTANVQQEDELENDSEGEDTSGPAEPVMIKEMDGGDRPPVSKVTIEDFDLLKVLGKGSFGKVMMVRKKDTKKIYAMKTLRKAALVKRNQILHTKTERSILQTIKFPFLTSLTYAFQTPDKLYLVMDYCGGGELFFWLKKDRRFSLQRARLFAAEIVLALQALHVHDIIYRDLKPENILLDLEGHIRITDFGLSKEAVTGAGAVGGTKTFCGTPEYLAPEILENKGHGKAVDWWSLGTLIYEMLTGLPPFYDQNMQRMYDKILNAPLRFPSFISAEAKDLLTGLLTRKVPDRLGSGPTDAEEIKAHPFFKEIDWDAVYRREVVPEFKPPNRIGSMDASNFDAEFTTEKPMDSVVTTSLSETQRDKAQFPGFTYNEDTIEEVSSS
uniref:non-specific serine/threonine protein kinase n=1 Tax=Albugo laibachii Nc14 TaxID=890382 RepID=F0WTQ1_9STRA|nr:protein kinase putative [Albugo laibachii Nc14]|eukprot:CCA24743.1 protein kinase putative [Albugo laibachii Nc14]